MGPRGHRKYKMVLTRPLKNLNGAPRDCGKSKMEPTGRRGLTWQCLLDNTLILRTYDLALYTFPTFASTKISLYEY